MQLWHRLTFEQKAIALFSAFILLATFHFLFIYYFQTRIENDARTIAVWQQEKIELKETLNDIQKGLIHSGNSSTSGLKIREYDQLLSTMILGGILPIYSTTVKPAENEASLLLEQLRAKWGEAYAALNIILNSPATKDTIVQHIEQVRISDTLDIYTSRVVSDLQTIPNPSREKALEYLSALAPEVHASNEEFLKLLINQHGQKKSFILNTALIFWIATVVFILMVLFKVRNEIFAPLNAILLKGEAISKGNINARVDEKHPHELGRISQVLNTTADTMQSATSFILGLGEGKIEEKLLGTSNVNENSINGALVAMQHQMQKIEKEEKERKWISEGLTHFADLLRSHNETIELLTDKVTSSLVKYTGSLVGGTYILNEQEPPELDLVAFYALNTKKYNNRRYKPGEGLVGQTFLEEDFIYLLEIPENYISVTTGIGEASPKAILLVPLKLENEVFGVIELASMREYRDYEIDFVKKLSESIAATIQNVKINQRTKRLLEESQEMTEQMRSQEEEMRQNMEELSATQEEMSRKEQEMTARLDAINNTLSLAEFDSRMNILHTNRNYAVMHTISGDKDNLTLLDLIPEDAVQELQDIWEQLLRGKAQQGIFNHKDEEGNIFSVESSYTPIAGSNGDINKIIELARKVNNRDGGGKQELQFSEVEEELRQNLEALDITQQQLTKRYEDVSRKMKALNEVAMTMETGMDGLILESSEKFKGIFGASLKNATELTGIKKDLFSMTDSTGEINYNNKIYNFKMRKINENSYFFLITHI